jgi:hypothetical protein
MEGGAKPRENSAPPKRLATAPVVNLSALSIKVACESAAD